MPQLERDINTYYPDSQIDSPATSATIIGSVECGQPNYLLSINFMNTFTKKLHVELLAITTALAMAGLMVSPALASGAAVVTTDVNTCSPTTFSAEAPGSNVSNQYLVVDDNSSVQSSVIPTDGSSTTISVGPFGADTTVSWRVFGGAERDYDMPAWNGYGSPGFGADVGAYAATVGGYSWVISGTDDANPFTTWTTVDVPGCYPTTQDECKKGGWENYGFKNQGQCVRFIETGKDSR